MRDEAPEKIGPYRLLTPIGGGGMGTVYRAVHEGAGVVVALKTAPGFSEALLPRIRREIYALARLTHPGVVRVLDQGEEGGRPWYAMELIEGVTLRDYCQSLQYSADTFTSPAEVDLERTRASKSADPQRNKSVSPETLREILTMVSRLCEPLSYLHGEGILHRDLKPDNVVVRKGGIPVLVDFGLALDSSGGMARESLQVERGLSGTVAYMSPESIRGEPFDARADLYAVGCILYELLAGHPPFVGKSVADVLYGHMHDAVVPLSSFIQGLPEGLDELLLSLLDKNPKRRTGYADYVAQRLIQLGASGARVYPAPPARPYLYRSEMAGREDPLSVLESRLSSLHKGRGGLLFIGGESGVGKTRLATEFAKKAAELEVTVLTGECFDNSNRPLQAFYKPFQVVADRCLAKGEEETRRLIGDRGRVLAEYMQEFSELPGRDLSSPLIPLPRRESLLRLQNAVAQTLFAFCRDQPVLLVLDDLQWADELSLSVLSFLQSGGGLDSTSLLIVGNYRSDEMNEPLASLIEKSGAGNVQLTRLGEQAISVIVGNMLAIDPPPQELSRYLAHHSEGNPFFVAEYLRTAVDEGLLRRNRDCAWEISEPAGRQLDDALPISRSLRELLQRRLDGLPDNALQTLQAASVLGQEASSSLLRDMAELSNDSFLEVFSELIRRHIFEEAARGKWRFAHGKLREVAYEQIAPLAKRALHRKAAEAIEKNYGTKRDDVLTSLAVHWENSGNSGKARGYYLSAARKSAARFALDEAARLYQKFLAIASPDETEAVTARNEFARDVLIIRGSNQQAATEIERALSAANQLGDLPLQATSLINLANAQIPLGHLQEAERTAGSAQEICRTGGLKRLYGEATRLMAIATWYQGNLESARALYLDALEIHRECGDIIAEVKTVSNLAAIDWNQGRLEEARIRFEQAIALGREAGQRRSEGIALNNLAVVYQNLGDLSRAKTLHQAALNIHREVGERRTEAASLSNLGTVAYMEGEMVEAESLYLQAMQIHREVGDRQSECQTLYGMARLYRECYGEIDRALSCITHAEKIARELDARIELATILCERGHLALAQGNSAREVLKEARQLALDARVGLRSESGEAIERLGRAVGAFEHGGSLLNGVRAEDIPRAVRSRLQRTGKMR